MAQIPTLPVDEPIFRQFARPQISGIAGETVASIGQETEELAHEASSVDYFLTSANRQLKAKEAQISFDRTLNLVHEDLSKATTPEQVQAIYEHSKGELDNAIAPYQTDSVLARELGIFRQQQDVELQHTVNAKKAQIISESDKAANLVLGQKSLQQAITTTMGGGSGEVDRKQFELQLESSVSHGTMTPQERDEALLKWDREYQKGVILAHINSPEQAVRQDTIKQLSEGGGALPHSMLGAEEIVQLRTHAVDTDHSLTQKEEAGSLNGALNIKAEAFASPEFHNADGTPNFEAREKALESGQWLKDHNIVTPDGKPNFVMAQKLMEDDAHQWQMHQKVQRDRDEEVLEKYSPMIYDPRHPLTIAQIENLPQTDGASSRAVNQLKTALFQQQRESRAEARAERGLALEERRERREKLQDQSVATSLSLTERMANGDVIDYNRDIMDPISKGKMTPEDGAKVWRMYKDSDQYPQIGEGIGIIAATFKALPSTPENNRKAADARDSFLKTVKEKNLHGADILQEAQRVAQETGNAQTGSFIQRMWQNITHGPTGGGTPTKPTKKDYGDAGGKPDGITGKAPDGTPVIVIGGRIMEQ